MDTRSGKSISKHEGMYSGIANGNRTKTHGRADNVSLRSQRGNKCSPSNREGLATNANLFRQPRLTSSRDKLQSNGKSSFNVSARYKKAEEVLLSNTSSGPRTSFRGQVLADCIAEKPDEEEPPAGV
ncbi:hypothetical protein Tco_0689241 [Tanacetum coccineum]